MDGIDEYGLPVWPAAERNKGAILNQLVSLLRERGGVFLEIAAATGQHAHHFAPELPSFEYVPSDYDEEHLETLATRHRRDPKSTLQPPVKLDAASDSWPLPRADVIYNANMMHIAPLEVSEGLFRGAGRILPSGGLLLTYGPYKLDGAHTSESNERFDQSLRRRNPSWGVRDLTDLSELGRREGLIQREPIPMPANNLLVPWDRV